MSASDNNNDQEPINYLDLLSKKPNKSSTTNPTASNQDYLSSITKPLDE